MSKKIIQNKYHDEAIMVDEKNEIAEKAFNLLQTFPFSFVENIKVIGDIMSLKDFLNNVKYGGIMEDDGCIGSVLVNGQPTNICVNDWSINGYKFDIYKIDLEELESINGKVEIEWCNK